MNEVLPNPHTRISAPMRPRGQPKPRPQQAEHQPRAEKGEPHRQPPETTAADRSLTLGISSSTSAGSATLITHQLMPGTMPAGGLRKTRYQHAEHKADKQQQQGTHRISRDGDRQAAIRRDARYARKQSLETRHDRFGDNRPLATTRATCAHCRCPT